MPVLIQPGQSYREGDPGRAGTHRTGHSRMGSREGSPSRVGTRYGSPSRVGTRRGSPSRVGTHYDSPSRAGTRRGSPSRVGTLLDQPSRAGTRRGSPSHVGTRRDSPSRVGTRRGSRSPEHSRVGPSFGGREPTIYGVEDDDRSERDLGHRAPTGVGRVDDEPIIISGRAPSPSRAGTERSRLRRQPPSRSPEGVVRVVPVRDPTGRPITSVHAPTDIGDIGAEDYGSARYSDDPEYAPPVTRPTTPGKCPKHVHCHFADQNGSGHRAPTVLTDQPTPVSPSGTRVSERLPQSVVAGYPRVQPSNVLRRPQSPRSELASEIRRSGDEPYIPVAPSEFTPPPSESARSRSARSPRTRPSETYGGFDASPPRTRPTEVYGDPRAQPSGSPRSRSTRSHRGRPSEVYGDLDASPPGTRPTEIYSDSRAEAPVAVHRVPTEVPGVVVRTPSSPRLSPRTYTDSIAHTGRRPPSGPSDLGYREGEAVREQRFGDLERQVLDLSDAAAAAEEGREQHFQRHEEDRDRIFQDNEYRRDEEAAQRREAIMEDFSARGQDILADLERRITSIRPLSVQPPVIVPVVPVESILSQGSPVSDMGTLPVPPPGSAPPGEFHEENDFNTPEGTVIDLDEDGMPVPGVVSTGSPRLSTAPSHRRPLSTAYLDRIQEAAQQAAERHAELVNETITREREELLREREEATMALLTTLRQEREDMARDREEQLQLMRDTIERERDELRLAREEAEAERERIRLETEEEKKLAADDRESRVRELEDEVARLRAELESERAARFTEEAEERERVRSEFVERDETLRAQLQDITNIVQDSNEEMIRKRELMDAQNEERNARRGEKDNRFLELRDMVITLIDQRETDRVRADAKTDEVRNSELLHLVFCHAYVTNILYRS
jgi:hypothetical protein